VASVAPVGHPGSVSGVWVGRRPKGVCLDSKGVSILDGDERAGCQGHEARGSHGRDERTPQRCSSHGSSALQVIADRSLEGEPSRTSVDTSSEGGAAHVRPPVPPSLERAASWSWRLLVCAAAALSVLIVLRYLSVIVLPVMFALTIAPALTPVARVLHKRLGRPAAALALLSGVAVVAGLIAIVSISVLAQYDELAASLAQATDDIVETLEGEPFNLSLDGSEDVRSTLASFRDEALGYAVAGVEATIAVVSGVILAVAVLYFVLRDGAMLWDWILRRFAPESRPAIDRAGRRAWTELGGFVRGTATIAFVDASLIGVGLWLLGVPVAFALAVLVFIGAFVPFVGAFLSGLVAVLVAFADQGLIIGLAALALVVAVQFVEGTFLQPTIQSRTVDLHPALILLAVAAGASLFGIVGAYLAVPVTAVVFAVVASLRAESSSPAETP
jgi:putative heme transporter